MQTRMIASGRVQEGRGDLSKLAGAPKIGLRAPNPRAAAACMNRTDSCAHIRTHAAQGMYADARKSA